MSIAVAVWCAACAVILAGIGWIEVTRHTERQGLALAAAAFGGLMALLASGIAFRNHEGDLFSFTALGATAVVVAAGMGVAAARVALRRLSSAGLLEEDQQSPAHEEETE